MNSECFRLRWLNDACYEIRLASGKGILIDPYIDESPYRVLSYEDVERADYVLISHTHFDHVLGLGKLQERFDSQVFAGRMAGIELAKQYDVPGYRMNLCAAGDRIVTEDFILDCYRGKHTKIGEIDRPSRWPENVSKEGLAPESAELNLLGSYEYMIYRLTLPNHMRILIWGGAATEDAIRQAARYEPDFTIAQLPREKPEQVARLYAAIGGQAIFPHHHDYFIARGEEGMRVIRETGEKLQALTDSTRLVCPEKGKWYQIRTSIELEKE